MQPSLPPDSPNRLRVLHVVAPAQFGGLESVVQALAIGHLQRGHGVAVAASVAAEPPEHPVLAPLRRAGVEVIPIVLPTRAYLRERRVLRKLFAQWGPDVVHTHGYRPDVLGVGVARATGIPVVTTVHGFTGGGWKNRMYERLQRRAFRRSHDAVVAVSAPLRAQLGGEGVIRSRLHLLPNAWGATGPLLERAAARAELGADPERFAIGWVGRLGREKGADVFIRALSHLADLPLEVHMVGDGRERQPLEAMAAAMGVPVRWHGRVAGAARLFPAFDLFVLSSRTEGTPIALLEAISAGVPVVATAVGGVPDVVTPREALLVPSEDPPALAAAIRQAYDDPVAAAARAAAAAERLRQQFALDPWLDAYERIYHSVRRL